MADDGFWLFEGLEEDPYGLLPLVNLSAKGGPTSIKSLQRVGSYQWYLTDQAARTILVPGEPLESFFWPGGRLAQDRGVVIYDVNHLKIHDGPLDPAIIAIKEINTKLAKPFDFGEFDFITDSVNLQKLFAFCQEAGDGLFRIDCERIGKTILLSRMEASDLMEIGHVTYDENLKQKMTKPRSSLAVGPFFQMVSYQFGEFRMLVRHEVDCADYAAIKKVTKFLHHRWLAVDKKMTKLESGEIVISPSASAAPSKSDPGPTPAVAPPEKHKSTDNPHLDIIDAGETHKHLPLQLLTTYPQGAGYPFFTWAQLFFTGADQEIVGWFKGNGDFGKSAVYSLQDISKLMKPLPYVVLSKVHDCLGKIGKFLLRNNANFRIALVWKGKPHLEIYEKLPDADGAVSAGVRDYLKTQIPDIVDEDEAAAVAEDGSTEMLSD